MTEAVAEKLFGSRFESIRDYVDILASRGIERGLLGPRESDRLWERHVLNSVSLNGLIPQGVTVVDIGSGAGLPGIPLGILRPDLQVTLLEPLLRRSAFLSEVVEELNLSNQVEVVRVRAEDHHARYDVVTSRALAPLDRLVSWSEPLRASRGQILSLKGASAQDEVDGSRKQLAARRLRAEVLTVRACPEAEPATVVRLTRSG
ncbi:MAG TPA: 16S rRNA (guanine(527)-N(7))-methyltransferase RsmG [Propionibacteriaceae bacterium]|nr:16S rRNA (guanine(527)-N(7))-methyltransferase RsmG [Propionibacteriaceae bacterium]